MHRNKKFIIIFSLTICVAFGAILFANALELNWPTSPGLPGITLDNNSDLTALVQYLYQWGIALGGLAAFVSLVIAGFGYLTSTGDPSKMQDAKDRATSAFLGLVLLLGSWLILNTINPELTTLRPIGFGSNLPTGDACTVDQDCPLSQNATEAGHPWSVKYTCENGFCMPDRVAYSCSRVNVCPYTMTSDQLWQRQPVGGPNGCVGYVIDEKTFQWIVDPEKVKSIQSFYTVNGVEYLCGPTACGCTIQLFAGGWLGILACGDMMVPVVAWDGNLQKRVDQEIHCIRIWSPESETNAFPS